MTIKTGRQFTLPLGSSLALLGSCPIPPPSSLGFGDRQGLAFMVEVEVGVITSIRPEDRRAYQQMVFTSILALLRHHSKGYFADFDPTLLMLDSTVEESTQRRLMFLTKLPPLHSDLRKHCRKLEKRLSWAWKIADWMMAVGEKDGHSRAENCPIRPIDVVSQMLDGNIAEIVPPQLRHHVRRWCACPIELRDGWSFYPSTNILYFNDESRQWLVGNQFLVQDGHRYWFTEKFVRMCWQDAMSKLV